MCSLLRVTVKSEFSRVKPLEPAWPLLSAQERSANSILTAFMHRALALYFMYVSTCLIPIHSTGSRCQLHLADKVNEPQRG